MGVAIQAACLIRLMLRREQAPNVAQAQSPSGTPKADEATRPQHIHGSSASPPCGTRISCGQKAWQTAGILSCLLLGSISAHESDAVFLMAQLLIAAFFLMEARRSPLPSRTGDEDPLHGTERNAPSSRSRSSK